MGVKVRVDADGVLADFAGAIKQRLGFLPDAPDADRRAMWGAISSDKSFWQKLDVLPGAKDLWAFLEPYSPGILTGVGGNPSDCRDGKRAWAKANFGCDAVSVTNAGRKTEFCRPGDVLIDDSQANVDAWKAAGGIGILYRDAGSAVAELRAMGMVGGGVYSPAFEDAVASKRADKSFVRKGYTGYVLSPAAQNAAAVRFGVAEGVSGNPFRLVCQHITRAFPARDDTVDDAQPSVEVVGEFLDKATGHHVLAVTVDGEVRRPGGGFYHITYALDDCPGSVSARGSRPKPADSNKLLTAAVEAAGGDVGALFNLGLDRRLALEVDFALLDQDKLAKMPVAKPPPPPETVLVEPWTFAEGVPDGFGGALTAGQRTTRTKGDLETVSYDVFSPCGVPHKHNDGGEPAIERRNTRTGEVLFRAWATDGVLSKQPPEMLPEAPSPV